MFIGIVAVLMLVVILTIWIVRNTTPSFCKGFIVALLLEAVTLLGIMAIYVII